MTFRRSFVLGLAWHVTLLLAAAFAFVWTLSMPGLGAARIVGALFCIGAASALWRFVQRTNMELARFVEAARLRAARPVARAAPVARSVS